MLASFSRCLALACAALLTMGFAPAEPLAPADAEALASAAEVVKSGDPARGRECAARLSELATRLGDADPRTAEVLTYTAQCQEAAGEYDAMVATRERLMQQFPTTPAARVALLALVRHYRATVAFERAAAAMERFAERWPGEREAIDLLEEAALLRAQLGQEKRALELFQRVEKLFAGKDPRRVAVNFWALPDLLPGTYADDQARRAHAQAYVERHGPRGGPGRLLVAEVTIAAIDWRRACKQKGGLMDLCVTSKPAVVDAPGRGKAPKLSCAGPTAQAVTVHARDPKLAEAAQARLREVVKLGKVLPPGEEPWLEMRVREALDRAEVILADRELEEALTLQVPSGLDFYVEDILKHSDKERDRKRHAEQLRRSEDSRRRFLAYWQQAYGNANKLSRRYEEVVARKYSPQGLFAAAARVAIVAQTQADRLLAAELPRGLGSEAAIKAYCGAMRDYTTPVEQNARLALEFCLARATAYVHSDASVEFCAAELERRLPRAHPRQRELFGPVQPPPIEPTWVPAQLEPPLDIE